MRVCIYTDNHFSQYSSIIRSRGNTYSTRLENQIKSLNWVEDLAKSESCDIIVCLGDFFDKSELNAEELTALQDVRWAPIQHYFLVGNHEMGLNNLDYTSTHSLHKIPMANIINKPFTLNDSYSDTKIVFIPYILEHNRKPLIDYIKHDFNVSRNDSEEPKTTIVFSHNDISGIRYGQYVSKSGFSIKDIDTNCSLFINGHLHNQEQISKKILNLGNLTGQNFSEDAFKHSHCAAILDTETLKVDLINNPYAFNFYKLDFTNCEDNKNIDSIISKCVCNSILTIKAYEKQIDYIKTNKLLDKGNIIEYRLISVFKHNDDNRQDIKDLVNIDHIEQFKNYILGQLGSTDILLQELSELI